MAILANAGAEVGDYILVKKLGEGGMAEVWLARHHGDAKLYAVKFLNSQFLGIPEVEARFQNEGESKLIHPNIVRIYEVGQQAGSGFIVMEFIDGNNLENILNARRGPLTVTESLDVGIQILAGLGFAHESGIVHRDIKPSNVLVDHDGHAYVMDFGIAKVLRTGRALTQMNSRLGTPDYMSPEQIRNPRDVDSRSDIYSFGCLFYELLTGWPPFDRGLGYETEHDIKDAHVNAPPMPPVQRKNSVPAQLNEITLKCLAKRKEDRPQSCDEIIQALYAYRVSATQQPRPSRAATVVEPPPRLTNEVKVQPQPLQPLPQRRETVVIPESDKPGFAPVQGGTASSGLLNPAGRTPTVVDPGPGNPGQGYSVQSPQVQSLPAQTHQSTTKTPGTTADAYGPPPSAAKQKSSGFLPMYLAGAASLFLLIALGVGGEAWYHKYEQSKSDESSNVSGTPQPDNTRPDNTQPNGGQSDPHQAQIAQVTPKDDAGKNANGQNGSGLNPSEPVVKMPPSFKPKLDQQTLDQLEIKRPIPSPAQPVSGTLIWTGDPSSTGQHVTIVRSSKQALEGGQLSGSMFPAGPVRITVRPPARATVLAPDSRTNYNSMQLFLPSSGQQTIYLDWTAIPNQ